ncbi:MAG: tRNA (guanosine(37)-N1)-methyltransferase TrmD [Clostridia bacterium]|nr:tRNA (guanosine(37)-N1)-methyltransferase TrmD [Clostridia bacterium]
MKIKIFTLFPEMLEPMLSGSILGRAIRAGHLSVELINIRDYTLDKHRSTDDYPFGGGAGMVMAAQPIIDAIEQNTEKPFKGRRIYLSPRGRTLTQKIVEELAEVEELVLLCGHYEGVDQRALDTVIDEELSIGDYVLTGGELGALVVVDSVSRMIPGVLGCAESGEDESFSMGLLEYPQYTRPADFRGMKVPEVLLGGNHRDIVAWRREQSLEITLERRPEMLETAPLDENDLALLKRIRRAKEVSEVLSDAGIPHVRMEMRLAESWSKAWFQAFVPAENRAAAKKQCFSGRRHIGFLWQAFSMNFAPSVSGSEAWDMWKKDACGPCILALPEEKIAFEISDCANITPELLDRFRGCIIADAALTRTFAVTGKAQYGPYFASVAES